MKNIKLMQDEALTMLHNSIELLNRSDRLLKIAEIYKSDLTEKMKGVLNQ